MKPPERVSILLGKRFSLWAFSSPPSPLPLPNNLQMLEQ